MIVKINPFLLKYFSGRISHNVPVINDGLTARISKTEGFAGLANCGGAKHHKGRSSA
jgi:hypothetical protein